MMRALFFAAALALAGCTCCEPRPNLGLYKEKLVAWHDSGAYAACFSESARSAATVLRGEIARREPEDRLAVVLDIDETALSNWGYLSKVGFDVQADTFREWTARHNDPALAPTLALFNEARAAGIPVFFISGRKENLRALTIRQLRAAGYDGWTGLYLEPMAYSSPSVAPFKSGVRRQLTQQGWKLVLNMGDQWSDLDGGFADHTVKLPNPFYFIR